MASLATSAMRAKSSLSVTLMIWNPNSVSTNPILPTLFLSTKNVYGTPYTPKSKPSSPV